MKKLIVLSLSMSLFFGCGAIQNMKKQQKGTLAGTAGGALLGAAVSKGSVWGILAGAAVGGVAGNLIGKKMDTQARELTQAVPTAEVNRVGEGINMTFDSSLAFKINSAELSSSYLQDLSAAAQVFKSYPDTNILIEGHTDDSGAAEYNYALSERRAKSVSNYFISQGISASRLTTKWFGETQPKYPNDDASREKNRRVELAIYANDAMVGEAKSGKLD
ncbi:OmpA family protein [Winogradskyella sp. PG-2]|uniref:OmpA family protein n=1 Tax=Winogradskyella sp. PG-2 TaxID=754409 RepID=UPI0004587636|nr:OmpA family protein [Winogradskyella sp. PG-2]BAO77586.1 immunogenic 23 kDa lipoprotein PG3 [Winogradskyella sp. PG-2]